MGKIRVIVADGEESSTASTGLLRAVLEREGVEIAGEVGTETELIQLAADEQPDAVVFATRAPQSQLDRLRRVAPASKVVFVSSILVAAEAEMAEAVVERADVLASLGPVLVHLCTPGRANARRAITESFDRPDWIDRVRKDPVTLREILSEHDDDLDEGPSVTSLQGQARETVADPDDLIVLADLEAETAAAIEPSGAEAAGPGPEGDGVPDQPSTRPGRRRRFGLWALALTAAGLAGTALLPSTVTTTMARAGDPVPSTPWASGANDPAVPADPASRPDRTPVGGRISSASQDLADGSGIDAGSTDPVAVDTGGQGTDPEAGGSDDAFGASTDHNPHGDPPGQSRDHTPGGPAPHDA